MSKELEFMWNGGNTRRFHTMHTIMPDFVGHHSYNVACIIMCLRPDASATLLRAALKHDQTEHIVGDMPAPTKRGLPNYVDADGIQETLSFREVFGDYEEQKAAEHDVSLEDADLNDAERWVLKLADSLDGMRFCIQERRMGNRHPKLVEAYGNFVSYVQKLLAKPPVPKPGMSPELELFLYLKREWACARR